MEKPQKGAKKIIVNDHEFWYFVGRQHMVLWGPDTTKQVVTLSEVKGIPGDMIERGRHKVSSDGMIMPSDVAVFISTKVLT